MFERLTYTMYGRKKWKSVWNSTETSLQVLEHIKKAVRIKLAGLRFPETAENRRLCRRWDMHNVC